MINYGKNKNVLAGNFQKTIRFAAHLLDTLEYWEVHTYLWYAKVYD